MRFGINSHILLIRKEEGSEIAHLYNITLEVKGLGWPNFHATDTVGSREGIIRKSFLACTERDLAKGMLPKWGGRKETPSQPEGHS